MVEEPETAADKIVARYLSYFPKQTYPIRSGVHPNTAFGLAFAYDYARAVGHKQLRDLLEKRSHDYFAARRRCPGEMGAGRRGLLLAELDGGGSDAALACGRRSFSPGFIAFCRASPRASRRRCSSRRPVTDRSDPQIVHLDGLNLSRAWCMRGIAAALPEDDPARKILADSAAPHAEAALRHVASGDYAGEHWLASFAVYMLSTSANPGGS